MMKQILLNEKDIHRGHLILINQNYRYMEELDTSRQLIAIQKENPNVLLEARTGIMLEKAMEALGCGSDILLVSGYRSQEEQESIYQDSYRENGAEFTSKYVALPGHSEHQTGLAIDLSEMTEDIDFICPSFPYTGICQTFREGAVQYGFIERYSKGKEHITGIGHEPWHLRYVGYPHAKIMTEEQLCLEEYAAYIRTEAPQEKPLIFDEKMQKIEVFYVDMKEKNTMVIDLPDQALYQISGDNIRGFIVTIWRNRE